MVDQPSHLTNQTTALHASVRAHSQKPDEFYKLVESLCPAPRYASLFARDTREQWDCHGDELPRESESDSDDSRLAYDAERDFAKSINVAYSAVRERVAAGGPTWVAKPIDEQDAIPDFLRRAP